jgi:hypothetical protein
LHYLPWYGFSRTVPVSTLMDGGGHQFVFQNHFFFLWHEALTKKLRLR